MLARLLADLFPKELDDKSILFKAAPRPSIIIEPLTSLRGPAKDILKCRDAFSCLRRSEWRAQEPDPGTLTSSYSQCFPLYLACILKWWERETLGKNFAWHPILQIELVGAVWQGKVIAMEPIPQIFRALKANVQLHKRRAAEEGRRCCSGNHFNTADIDRSV